MEFIVKPKHGDGVDFPFEDPNATSVKDVNPELAMEALGAYVVEIEGTATCEARFTDGYGAEQQFVKIEGEDINVTALDELGYIVVTA